MANVNVLALMVIIGFVFGWIVNSTLNNKPETLEQQDNDAPEIVDEHSRPRNTDDLLTMNRALMEDMSAFEVIKIVKTHPNFLISLLFEQAEIRYLYLELKRYSTQSQHGIY